MSAYTDAIEDGLSSVVVDWFRERLPDDWTVQPSARVELANLPTARLDAAIDLRGPNGTSTTFLAEFKNIFGPRDVDRLRSQLGTALRKLAGNIPILIVTPWLSENTRGRLRAEGMNYLDLTGNAFIRLDYPTLFIQTDGASRNPEPLPRGKATIQGPKAGRLIRLLMDVRPPYGVRALASAAGLNPGYVSRILETLDGEALIDRGLRGVVERADISGLVRRWTQGYDVFRSNPRTSYLAPGGASSALRQLANVQVRGAVTGSFAAVRKAPVAAPALLVVYTDEPSKLATELQLFPTDQGANVVLLRPFDQVVWDQTETEDGVRYVAPSQAAADCLTGNGRMPAEGEALLAWMVANENSWRLAQLRGQAAA